MTHVKITFKTASVNDCELMFKWANDVETRKNAFNSNPIDFLSHVAWFNTLNLNNVLIFHDVENTPIGVVRIDYKNDEWVVTTMVDSNHRGKGYASEMLKIATHEFLKKNNISKIIAYIKISNTASKKVFDKAGFTLEKVIELQGFSCYRMLAM